MPTPHFDDIARRYEQDALVQKGAAEILLDLLAIGPREDVLDLGCGTGHLTGRIAAMTSGRVLGRDPSPRMIAEAARKHGDARVSFEVGDAETLAHADAFDAIFCNSAFQWFREPARAVGACHRALRRGGRMAVQAPAGARYCPSFLAAIDEVSRDPVVGPTMTGFRNPWFFRDRADDYSALFADAGFEVPFARIDAVRTRHAPEEAMRVFESGAAAGYLNPAQFDPPPPAGWADAARAVVRGSFERQAGPDGLVDLVFYRLYLVARKPARASTGSERAEP